MTQVFSYLFLFISLWIGLATILTHIVYTYGFSYSFYYVIWIFTFIFSLSIFLKPILSQRKSLKDRFSKSVSWPHLIKLINGLSWALPFLFIPFFHRDYPFLLLTGMSSGNISTFIFLRRYSKIYNIEQIITGAILLSSLFGVLVLYYGYSKDYELLLFTSRILMSLSYGVGGIIGYLRNK